MIHSISYIDQCLACRIRFRIGIMLLFFCINGKSTGHVGPIIEWYVESNSILPTLSEVKANSEERD